MLELLISIMLAMGFSFDKADCILKVNSEIISKMQSEATYDKLGGDKALASIPIGVTNEPQKTDGKEIVITDDTDPSK